MSQKETLVIGATGLVGSAVLANLLREKRRVRATTRDPRGMRGANGLRWAELDMDHLEMGKALFENVERVFLLSPSGVEDPFRALGPLAALAARARVQKVVMMTLMGPDDGPSAAYRRAEGFLQRCGVPFNILRPNWFMQNFHTAWGEGIRAVGKIFLPAGDAPVSFVDVRDIADVAAKLLFANEHAGKTFTLTGPAALNHADAARFISQAVGKPVGYQDVAPDDFKKALLSVEVDDAEADVLNALFAHVRAGEMSPVTADVQTVLGRPARAFQDYARDHRADLTPET